MNTNTEAFKAHVERRKSYGRKVSAAKRSKKCKLCGRRHGHMLNLCPEYVPTFADFEREQDRRAGR